MTTIDVAAVGAEAARKMLAVLTGAGKDVIGYARGEANKLAVSASEIATLRLSGRIDDEEAALQLDIQKNASKAVLSAIEGISILAAEQAVNAALGVIGTAIKGATGLSFLS